MSKTAIFLAEGFEMIEALTVVDMLRRAGITIDTVSINDSYDVVSSHGVSIKADKLLSDVCKKDAQETEVYDMLILPGGMPGTKNLEACEPLMAMLDEYYKADKNIAAICAAPTVFGHKGYLEGKSACCYPNMEDQLLGAVVSYSSTVTDGNIITARGMGTAIDFAIAIIEKLESAELAEKIARAIVYA